ncbi:MAG: transposase domain-containing protein, partial [Bacteroidales bacterium]|nr:transposase domain-containing protein [Bacteroidales bacterium]
MSVSEKTNSPTCFCPSCGNHDSAENAAIKYSLLGCCKACGVNPREWLTDVLSKIPAYNNDYSRDLADL